MKKIEEVKLLSSLYTQDSEINVAKSPFAAYELERAIFDGKDKPTSKEQIMSYVYRNLITPIDYVIIYAVYQLGFATSRMVTQFLELNGIGIEQAKVRNRLQFFNKHKIISRYKFANEEKEVKFRAYFLEQTGKILLISRNYDCDWKYTDNLKDLSEIKGILARNQVLLKIRRDIKNLGSYSVEQGFRLARTGKYLKPHLKIELNVEGKSEFLLFEVVRSFEGYKEKFVDRLSQYQEYYEYFQPSEQMLNPPRLIIVGEDDKHCFELYKVMLKSNISLKNIPNYIFTSELRTIQYDINKCFIKFEIIMENGKAKSKMTELNFPAFKI